MPEAVVIDAGYFLRRVGEPDERPRDRHFCYRIGRWELDARWRAARAARDYEAMDSLEREERWLECL